MNTKIFKAYDVRGKYPSEINEGAVAEISEALARYFKRGKIVIGHDARLSSPSLYNAVIKAFSVKRLAVSDKKITKTLNAIPYTLYPIPIGLSTTPMFYFLVNKLGASGGIMITASHNPKEYNGLKVVGPKAEVISGEEILALLSKIVIY